MSFVKKTKVAGIILAAGASSRFGRLKQTLPWGEENLVNTVIATASVVGLDPIMLVLGNRAEEIEATIRDEQVQILHNPNWQEGQSTSLKIAAKQLSLELNGAVFLLCDQPQLSANFLSAIVEEGCRSNKVVVPYVNDRRSSPVYFPSSCFPLFEKLSGDQGGRQIIAECPHTLLLWLDDWMVKDIDTPEDYRQLCLHYGMPLAADIV